MPNNTYKSASHAPARPALARSPLRQLLGLLANGRGKQPTGSLHPFQPKAGGCPAMPASSYTLALEAKGFLSAAEGLALFELAVESSRHAPCLEVGSYCGKST